MKFLRRFFFREATAAVLLGTVGSQFQVYVRKRKMIALTKKELANIAGYTYQRLYTIDRDLPESKKLFVKSGADEKKYDLAIFVQRWVAYNKVVAEDENQELSVVKAQHERIKKQKTQIEVERLRGELVEIQEVQRLWANIASTVKGRFVNLARKLAPALVMIDSPDKIEEIIDRDVRDALTMIAETPLPGEENYQPEDDKDEEE